MVDLQDIQAIINMYAFMLLRPNFSTFAFRQKLWWNRSFIKDFVRRAWLHLTLHRNQSLKISAAMLHEINVFGNLAYKNQVEEMNSG